MKKNNIHKKVKLVKEKLNEFKHDEEANGAELKEILRHLEVSFGMEGYDLTAEDKEMVARIVSGESDADEEVRKIIKKHAK